MTVQECFQFRRRKDKDMIVQDKTLSRLFEAIEECYDDWDKKGELCTEEKEILDLSRHIRTEYNTIRKLEGKA